MKSSSLTQLVDQHKLVRIIESFTKATDITIDINDAQGYPVVQHKYFYGFCRDVRSTELGLRRCIESNAKLGFKTVQQGSTCMDKCHAGVMLMAVPIVVDGQYWGSITCGQMHLDEPGEQDTAAMMEVTKDLGLDRGRLAQTFKEIQVISREKCQAAGDLIQVVVNYIVELIYRAKIHEELNREKLKAVEEERIIMELEHTLHKAELKNLQAQIKPHFLFNTLNTITGLVTLDEKEKALNTLFALANLLRHNLDHPGELVSLREEINYVESYLLIQKNRFGSRLEIEVIVPQELSELQVPFLSLQPLVENACIHGLEPREGKGRLGIIGRRVGDTAEVTVFDDGVGMPPGYTISTGAGERGPGIGLPNVHRRLQLQFGDQYGVRISSSPGKTEVSLLIPCC